MSITWMFPRGVFFQSLYQSYYTTPVSPEFLSSPSFKFVNPQNHAVGTDKIVQRLPATAVAGLSDEQVIAMFSRGFFSGFVLGFERLILRIGGYNLLPARYTGFQPGSQGITIWNRTEVPETHILSTGSCLFGSFIILDKHSADPSDQTHSSSYVDYGFGSDEFTFAGCHRFQITRLSATSVEPGSGSGNKEPQVELQLQHFRCNPQENVASVAEYAERFHFAYAKALFANGVQSVLSSSSEQS